MSVCGTINYCCNKIQCISVKFCYISISQTYKLYKLNLGENQMYIFSSNTLLNHYIGQCSVVKAFYHNLQVFNSLMIDCK